MDVRTLKRIDQTAEKKMYLRDQLVTVQDPEEFRTGLLNDLRQFFNQQHSPEKKWLKSSEVRKLLKISPNTLQNLRVNGTLRYTKVGGIFYYQLKDIEMALDNGDYK